MADEQRDESDGAGNQRGCREMSVEENLTVAARPGRWTVQAIYALFPRLAERRVNMGNQLSGGEQQMLAIGRALMTHPELIILDEATEGLAPLIAREIWAIIKTIRASGIATVIVDKDGNLVSAADVVVTKDGRVLTKQQLAAAGLSVNAAGEVVDAQGKVVASGAAIMLLGMALVVGGAGALNMWLERDVDALMRALQRRKRRAQAFERERMA